MSGTPHLKILQYNVQRKKDAVMAPLLKDEDVKDIDVLAIQEPARNLMNRTSYNTSTGKFHLAHGGDPEARTCFYVNKRIDPDKWGVEYRGGDLCSLWIETREPQKDGNSEAVNTEEPQGRRVWVHNVYNPSPVSYTSVDSPTTIPKLGEALESEGEHVVVGDFNLHHPQWNNPGRTTYHAAADTLLEMVGEKAMELGLPEGSVTWQNRGSESAIDLVFLTEGAHNAMAKCGVREDLDMGSDHMPIVTELEWTWGERQIRQKRAWKRVETKATGEEIRNHARILGKVMGRYPLDSVEAIDRYIDKLLAALQEIVEDTIPYKEPFAGAKPYWNGACTRATKESRLALKAYRHNRNTQTEEALRQAERKKVTTLRKTRTIAFREGVHKASLSPGGVWQLAKWGRERSMRPKELPQFPAIKNSNGDKVTDFEGKVEALRRVLFPPPPPADLADMEEATYPEPIAMDSEVTAKEVREAI